jgi:hypothetical protein
MLSSWTPRRYKLLSYFIITNISITFNIMSLPNESLIDEDVYGDGAMEGLTYAVHNVQGMQEDDLSLIYDFDQDRLAYIEDVFEGSSDRVTRWKPLLLPF